MGVTWTLHWTRMLEKRTRPAAQQCASRFSSVVDGGAVGDPRTRYPAFSSVVRGASFDRDPAREREKKEEKRCSDLWEINCEIPSHPSTSSSPSTTSTTRFAIATVTAGPWENLKMFPRCSRCASVRGACVWNSTVRVGAGGVERREASERAVLPCAAGGQRDGEGGRWAPRGRSTDTRWSCGSGRTDTDVGGPTVRPCRSISSGPTARSLRRSSSTMRIPLLTGARARGVK